MIMSPLYSDVVTVSMQYEYIYNNWILQQFNFNLPVEVHKESTQSSMAQVHEYPVYK